MDNETEKIFKEQLVKLPSEVVDFLSSTNWDTDLDEIGALYNLPEEELSGFKREATLVLAGLVHPDAFGETLEQEVGIKGAVLEAIVANVENKIFAPIRPALIAFFEKEAAENTEEITEEEPLVAEIPVVPTPVPAPAPSRIWEREPDVAPDNLPTAEEPESFLPPIPPKPIKAESEPLVWDITHTPSHPFEEKMKRVFTAGDQSMGDLTLVPVAPSQKTTPQPTTDPDAPHTDPYREAIE